MTCTHLKTLNNSLFIYDQNPPCWCSWPPVKNPGEAPALLLTLTSLCCIPCSGVSHWLTPNSFHRRVQSASPCYLAGGSLAPPPLWSWEWQWGRGGEVSGGVRAATLPEKRRITDRKSAKRVADRAQSGAVTRQFPGGLSCETEAEVGLKQVRLPALSVRSQVALLSTGAASS